MTNNFQVDLHGIVELLSNHLYSGPQVYLRELLQNAVDATTAGAEISAAATSKPDIRFKLSNAEGHPTLSVTDRGVGLSADDAREFMGVIGRSSKRDEIGMARESLIGQFGVGILSCFTVSEQIIVDSKVEGGQPIRWVGRSDGTWEVTNGEDRPTGTTVTVACRPGDEKFFDAPFVAETLRDYGELLPYRIWLEIDDENGVAQTPQLLSRDPAPLSRPLADPAATMELGRDLLGIEPLDFFPISSVAGQVKGVAFVMPYEMGMTAERGDRVYVKGMLVSPTSDRILPSWAFFVRAVLNANGLHPTASREELHDDSALEEARHELGDSIKAGLNQLAMDHDRLERIVGVHHRAMKALAIEDPEFLKLVADWLPIETSVGFTTVGTFARAFPVAAVTNTVDEFRQMAPIATAQGIGLICGGYTNDREVVEAAARVFDDFTVDKVQTDDLFAGFGELDADETNRVKALIDMGQPWFDRFAVELLVRRFEPYETPALLAIDDHTNQIRILRRTKAQSNDLFAGIIDALEPESDTKPKLCLNIGNPTIEQLVDLAADGDEAVELIQRTTEVLYLQALLMGHHPLSVEESVLLNTSLSGLIGLAMNNPSN